MLSCCIWIFLCDWPNRVVYNDQCKSNLVTRWLDIDELTWSCSHTSNVPSKSKWCFASTLVRPCMISKNQRILILCIEFVGHPPYKAGLQQLHHFSLSHHVKEYQWSSKIPHTAHLHPPNTHTRLRGHAYKNHQQGCYTHPHQIAFSVRALPFFNHLPPK